VRLGTVAAAVAAAVLFALFVWLAAASGPDSALAAWDRRVSDAFIAWRTSGRSQFYWALTLVGDTPVLAALSFSAVMLLAVWGRRGWAALIAVGLLVGWGISEGAKGVVGRVRPPVADALVALPASHSMPSSHALASLVFLGLLVYVVFAWRARSGPAAAAKGSGLAWAALLVAVVIAGLIGVSRVYLGVHWLSDVFGGWCLGGAWLAVFLMVVRRAAPAAAGSWRDGAGHGWRSLGERFFAGRRPARPVMRGAAVVIAVVVCLVAVVMTAMADPLLLDL
jgi:membrane-associated phospholipid phosphatase